MIILVEEMEMKSGPFLISKNSNLELLQFYETPCNYRMFKKL